MYIKKSTPNDQHRRKTKVQGHIMTHLAVNKILLKRGY